MTGFGQAVTENDQLNVTVEIKTLNSKFADISLKLSQAFAHREIEVKNMVSQFLERGKVNMLVSYTPRNAEANRLQLNMPLIKSYYQTLEHAAMQVGAGTGDVFRMVMQMPDVYVKEVDEEALEADWNVVVETIRAALKNCDQFRMQEGKSLELFFRECLASIRKGLAEVEALDPMRMQKVRERLRAQVAEWSSQESFDANRFEQELIYYIEKLDINEEKSRLRQHLDFFEATLAEPQSNGKRLNFISQELGREINTIGSKANDAAIQQVVVKMKEELEKIKEQILNVL